MTAEDSSMIARLAKMDKRHNVRLGTMDSVAPDIDVVPSGNIGIDWVTGVWGLPLGRTIEMFGPPASGKSLDLDAPVLTPDRGFVRMGDLTLGDRVVDPMGEDSQVLGIFPQGVLPVYRMTFSDGTWAESSGDHLWEMWDYVKPRIHLPLQCGGSCADCGTTPIRARGLCISCYSSHRKMGTLPPRLAARTALYGRRAAGRFVKKVLTTDEIRARSGAIRVRLQLPLVERFDFDEVDLPLDPYLLGVLLGDGGLTGNSPRLTVGQEDAEATLGEVTPLLPAGVSLKPVGSKGIDYAITKDGTTLTRANPLTDILRDLGVNVHSWEKFIPDIYKYASFDSRLAVLQGLMDTDGNWCTGGAEFTSSSKTLRDDVVEVARSLGLIVRIGKDKVTHYTTPEGVRVPCRTAYRLSLTEREDLRVFRLERKRRKVRSRGFGRRQVTSVEYVGDRECQCIKVSAPSELFLTNDYIPTHNTTTALQAAVEIQRIIKSGGNGIILPDDIIVYLDYENSMDKKYARALGLDTKHRSFVFGQPDYLEDGANALIELIDEGGMRWAIIDSVAAMQTKAEDDGEIGKSFIAPQAKQLKSFGKKLNYRLRETNGSVVFINHELEQIGGMSRPGVAAAKTTPGGKAIKFFASVRLQFTPGERAYGTIKDPVTGLDKRVPISTDTRVKAVKNKIGPPFREQTVRVRYGKGFDNFYTAIKTLVTHKKVTNSGAYYYFDRTDEVELAAEWMDRNSKNRPYIQGEQALMNMADSHQEWRSMVIEYATKILHQVTDDDDSLPTVIPEEDSSEELDEVLGAVDTGGNKKSF